MNGSFSNEEKFYTKKNKKKVTCIYCGKSFKNGSGKIPKHTCKETLRRQPPTIQGVVNEVQLNGLSLQKNDCVLFIAYPFDNYFRSENYEGITQARIENLFLLSDGEIYFKFENNPDLVPVRIFNASKNFIKTENYIKI